MPVAAQLLYISITWGMLAGLFFGALYVSANGYVGQGLTKLAIHAVAHAAWTYLAASLVGWMLAIGIRAAGQIIAKRLGRWGPDLLGVGTFLACTMPVFVWTVWHDTWMYPRSRELIAAGFAILCLLHIPGYYIFVRPVVRKDFAGRYRRVLSAAAWLAFGVVAVLVGKDRWAGRPSAEDHRRPNVLVVVLDTVRADRLSCYGSGRRTTPEIDAFAREGIRFTNFYSTSCWTVPSHASLFTGLHAARHRATQEQRMLANRFATLAEVFLNGGYQTWAASENPLVGVLNNMTQGFESFNETWREAVKWYYAEGGKHPNNEAFRRFLSGSDRDRPYFAFLNYMEAHYPYTPKEPYLSRFLEPGVDRQAALELGQRRLLRHFLDEPFSEEQLRTLSDLYDGEVAYLSHVVGDLLKIVREDGRYDDTLIVVASDHGEYFGEHGLVTHVFGIYNTTVKVPLIIRLPGGRRAGQTDERTGQIVDLPTTILRACGIDHSAIAHHGHDLLSGADSDGRQAVFSEYYYPVQVLGYFSGEDIQEHGLKLTPYLRRLRAYQSNGYRFIWSSDERHEFYDLTKDPGETTNLYDPNNPSALAIEYLDRLEQEVQTYRGPTPFPPEPDLRSVFPGVEAGADAETIDALRSIGYLK